MKKKLFALLVFCMAQSCALYESPILGEKNFPLREHIAIPIEGTIREIAVAKSWIAVSTYDKIFAIDIDTQKILWGKDFSAITYAEGLLINDDDLFAASPNKILLIHRDGQEEVLDVSSEEASIGSLVSANSTYLYFVQGPNWTFTAFDVSENISIWKVDLGRGSGDEAYYDLKSNRVLVTGGSIWAFDSVNGALLWRKNTDTLSSTFADGKLYAYVDLNGNNKYRIMAIDIQSQKEIWSHDYTFSPAEGVNKLTIIDELIVLSGKNLIALDKSSGKLIWESVVGEPFYTSPIEFDGTLYAKAGTSGTVYAVSRQDGHVKGTLSLEQVGFLEGVDLEGIYGIKDGIVFNTKNEVFIYK